MISAPPRDTSPHQDSTSTAPSGIPPPAQPPQPLYYYHHHHHYLYYYKQ